MTTTGEAADQNCFVFAKVASFYVFRVVISTDIWHTFPNFSLSHQLVHFSVDFVTFPYTKMTIVSYPLVNCELKKSHHLWPEPPRKTINREYPASSQDPHLKMCGNLIQYSRLTDWYDFFGGVFVRVISFETKSINTYGRKEQFQGE